MIDGIDRALSVTEDPTGMHVLVTLDDAHYTWDATKAIGIATDIIDAASLPFPSPVRIEIGMDTITATPAGARAFGAQTAIIASRLLDAAERTSQAD